MKLKIGDRVRHVDDEAMEGEVIELFTEPGRVVVRWDNGVELNQFEKELRKITAEPPEVKPSGTTKTDNAWIKSLYVSVCETLRRYPITKPKAIHLRKVVTDLERSYTSAIARLSNLQPAPITDVRLDVILDAVNAGYTAERKRRIELEEELARKDAVLRTTVKQLSEAHHTHVSESVHRVTQSERDAWCARAQKAEEKLAAIQATLAK